MAAFTVKGGTTSQLVEVFIQDSSVTTGAGLTGLVYNSGSLTAYYAREGAAATQISLVTMTVNTWTSSGFVVKDATNMPGVYQLGLPNAAIAAGVKYVTVYLKGATNMAPCVLQIEIEEVDRRDSVRGGMTALPNAAAEASGGLYTRGTGAGQINQPANGQVDSNAVKVGGTAQTGRDIGASVLLSPGAGTGQLDFTSGVLKCNMVKILGSAITGTATNIVAAFTKWFNVTTPTGTVNSLPDAIVSPATIADQVWDEATSGHATAGSTGKALTDAGAAGSPPTVGDIADAVWDEVVSDHVSAGTFGNRVYRLFCRLLGKKLDVDSVAGTITTRAEDGTTAVDVQTKSVSGDVTTYTRT